MTEGDTPTSTDAPPPRVSVVVRSYNRVPALCELIPKLLEQDHDAFEIVGECSDGAEAVDTSFPGFVALMQSLGADITEQIL